MKERQYNGQKKHDKGTNNDLQNTTQKAKDRVTRTLPKTRGACSMYESYAVYQRLQIIACKAIRINNSSNTFVAKGTNALDDTKPGRGIR